jgi:ribosomal protein S4E
LQSKLITTQVFCLQLRISYIYIMTKEVSDGASCKVIGGTHKGKAGIVRDINTSKTGAVTITIVQADGVRFKTLAKNVEVTQGN